MINLPLGNSEFICIELPPGWRLINEILPSRVRPLENIQQSLIEGLNTPVNHPGLQELVLTKKKITVVVDDHTRPTPVSRIFPVLLDLLVEKGVIRQQITIIIATGTHRAMSREEIGKRLGMGDLSGFTIINHDCQDASMLQEVGWTDYGRVSINKHVVNADLAFLIGTIEPHLLAGFGGGLKNIVPGCAGFETIAATHLSLPAEMRFTAIGRMNEDCPIRRHIEESALVPSLDYFLINTVLNPDGSVAGIFCGDPVQTHRQGCQMATAIYGVPVKEKADVIILSSHPMNHDLRQATKCLAGALAAARPGALLIAFMRCLNGVGDMVLPKPFLPMAQMQCRAREWGVERLIELRNRQGGLSMDMDQKYMNQFLCEIMRRHTILVYAPDLSPDVAGKLGYFDYYDDIERLMQRAVSLVPPDALVISSPYGGICYATVAGERGA